MNPQITYSPHPYSTALRVHLSAGEDGTGRTRIIGEIRSCGIKGYRYVPKGVAQPDQMGEIMPSVLAVKKSLESEL